MSIMKVVSSGRFAIATSLVSAGIIIALLGFGLITRRSPGELLSLGVVRIAYVHAYAHVGAICLAGLLLYIACAPLWKSRPIFVDWSFLALVTVCTFQVASSMFYSWIFLPKTLEKCGGEMGTPSIGLGAAFIVLAITIAATARVPRGHLAVAAIVVLGTSFLAAWNIGWAIQGTC
jgi:hypothetical protein